MLHHLRWLIDSIQRNLAVKRLANAELRPFKPAMLDTYHEVGVYIHRFHNLDLFQQGWYQIKITMKWEHGDNTVIGIPSKIVQYEAPNSGTSDCYGVWRIDDTDNSFATQPFKIRFARQDVLLSVMVAFNVSLSNREVPSKSGVIIKFEHLHAAFLEKGSELQASLRTFPAAIHEFRVPPKALLGLHSYCPILFDAFHSVLVDTSIHVSMLKSVSHSSTKKALSISCYNGTVGGKFAGKSTKLKRVPPYLNGVFRNFPSFSPLIILTLSSVTYLLANTAVNPSFSSSLRRSRHRTASPMAAADVVAADSPNPLLLDFDFPPYDAITAAHVHSSLKQLEVDLDEPEKSVDPKWENLVEPLEIIDKLIVVFK
ncbi:hypothetical protein RND81_13G097900 [Saponaria officinalis]|uniref:Uncharacterized protein n=1 Tax=Saponaria officinalis TaxID=3572 RepID=A0AAW1GYP5_SAPOF